MQENIGNEPRCSTNDVKIPVGPQERPLNKPLKKPRSTGFWYKNPVARIGVSIFKGIDKVFLHFWVGPPIDKGEWTKTHSKNNLLDRYGPMFEDCRCVRMVMTRYSFLPTPGVMHINAVLRHHLLYSVSNWLAHTYICFSNPVKFLKTTLLNQGLSQHIHSNQPFYFNKVADVGVGVKYFVC